MNEEERAECLDLASETYDIIRTIQDPEKVQTLEELDVVNEELVKVTKISPRGSTFLIDIQFTPTVPHCSLGEYFMENCVQCASFIFFYFAR